MLSRVLILLWFLLKMMSWLILLFFSFFVRVEMILGVYLLVMIVSC